MKNLLVYATSSSPCGCKVEQLFLVRISADLRLAFELNLLFSVGAFTEGRERIEEPLKPKLLRHCGLVVASCSLFASHSSGGPRLKIGFSELRETSAGLIPSSLILYCVFGGKIRCSKQCAGPRVMNTF